jgi:uncharacterized protein
MDRLEKNIKILRELLEHEFNKDKTGHSADHLERTLAYALKLCEKEGGNRDIIGVAAYIHDVHRLMGAQLGRFCTPEESLPKVREILLELDLNEDERERIVHAVKHHEEYSFGKEKVQVTDIESMILQDADNLDSTGAIAIIRSFRYGSANKMPDYDPTIEFYQNEYSESINDKSTIHHLYNKSLRIGNYMHTQTAKDIAKEKMKLIKDFIDLYLKEFNCDF